MSSLQGSKEPYCPRQMVHLRLKLQEQVVERVAGTRPLPPLETSEERGLILRKTGPYSVEKCRD
jgi:hypothetical protein